MNDFGTFGSKRGDPWQTRAHMLVFSICYHWAGFDLQRTQVTTGVSAIRYINGLLTGKPTKKQVEVALQLVVIQ